MRAIRVDSALRRGAGTGGFVFAIALAAAVVAVASRPSAGQASAPARPQSEATLRLEAPQLNQIADGAVTVELRAEDVADLGAFELDVDYTQSIATLGEVIPSGLLGQAEESCDPDIERCQVALGPVGAAGQVSLGAYTYGTGAGAGSGVLATLAFEPTGASGRVTLEATSPQLADVDANAIASVGDGTWFELGTSGNCNNDQVVDAGDISALVLEIFDADGAIPLNTRNAGFDGSPVGCNANDDSSVDAGDISCAVLLIFNGPGACGG